MNFVRYNPDDGVITSMGWAKDESVQEEIDAGGPIISIDQIVEWGKFQVNLETKQLEPIPAPTPPPEVP